MESLKQFEAACFRPLFDESVHALVGEGHFLQLWLIFQSGTYQPRRPRPPHGISQGEPNTDEFGTDERFYL